MIDERLLTLEQQLAMLAARVEALERAAATPSRAELLPGAQLSQQRAAEPEPAGPRGAITYAGAVQLGDEAYEWQIERHVPWLLGLSPAPLAQILAALGSPIRLQLLQALLDGMRSSQQLQEALGVASPGQLYHHLKELLAAGVIEQRGRSAYQIAPRKIVPLLAILAAAVDLGAAPTGGEPA